MKKIIALLPFFAALLFSSPVLAKENSATDLLKNETWLALRTSLFGDREINLDQKSQVLEMSMSERAEDASSVPVIVRATQPQSDTNYITRIWLIADHNPSPVSGVFRFTPASGLANVETRIRIENFTHVRAIAEDNDGRLFMTGKWIKAAGGCSVPAGGDSMSPAGLGRMKFKVNRDIAFNAPNKAQLMISHPNISGLAKDHASGSHPSPHFVKQVDVTFEGTPVMNAEVDFSISMNPVFRFYFKPERAGSLKAVVSDSNDLKFEHAIAIGK